MNGSAGFEDFYRINYPRVAAVRGPDGHRADFRVPMPADRIASARIVCRPLPRLLP